MKISPLAYVAVVAVTALAILDKLAAEAVVTLIGGLLIPLRSNAPEE